MEAKHIITQLVGLAAAAGTIGWAIVERRRFHTRVPLVDPNSLRQLVAVLAGVLPAVPLLYLVFAAELVPTESSLLIVVTLGWVITIAIGALFALLARASAIAPLGWLTFVDERTLRIEMDGATDTLVLTPGSVRAYFTAKPRCLRFDIAHGPRTLRIISMAPLLELGLAKEGVVVAHQGPTLAASSKRFLETVRPYLARD